MPGGTETVAAMSGGTETVAASVRGGQTVAACVRADWTFIVILSTHKTDVQIPSCTIGSDMIRLFGS
jgi:hypothetical protein